MKSVSLRSDWESMVMDAIQVHRGKVCVLGGRAFRHHLVGKVPHHLVRPPGDLDLFTVAHHRKTVTGLLEDVGLEPDREFNLYNGKTRLIYYAGAEKVDVFIDEFRMCHTLDLSRRISLESVTLPIADLVLTKLQIFELTDKDLRDLFLIFAALPLSTSDASGQINATHIAQTLSRDWGLWRTCSQNLTKLKSYAQGAESTAFGSEDSIDSKVDALIDLIEQTPKSIAWRMRSVVGDRVKWYELPEEP